MVKLRLTRMGAINNPFYRVVAVDAGARRDGRYIESIGHYDPKQNPATVVIDEAKALKWLKVGAQPSETVTSLLRKTGVLKKWHEIRYNKTEDKVVEKPKKTEKVEKVEAKIEVLEEKVEEKIEVVEEVVETAEEIVETVEEPVIEESLPELTAESFEEEVSPSVEESTEEPVSETPEENN